MRVENIPVQQVTRGEAAAPIKGLPAELREGDSFSARIVFSDGTNVHLKTPDGQLFRARLEGGALLAEGKTVHFLVSDIAEGTVRLIVEENGNANLTAREGFYMSRELAPLADQLRNLGLPVTRQTVGLMQHILSQQPSLPPEKAAFLAASGISEEPALRQAALNLLEGQGKIGDLLLALAQSVESLQSAEAAQSGQRTQPAPSVPAAQSAANEAPAAPNVPPGAVSAPAQTPGWLGLVDSLLGGLPPAPENAAAQMLAPETETTAIQMPAPEAAPQPAQPANAASQTVASAEPALAPQVAADTMPAAAPEGAVPASAPLAPESTAQASSPAPTPAPGAAQQMPQPAQVSPETGPQSAQAMANAAPEIPPAVPETAPQAQQTAQPPVQAGPNTVPAQEQTVYDTSPAASAARQSAEPVAPQRAPSPELSAQSASPPSARTVAEALPLLAVRLASVPGLAPLGESRTAAFASMLEGLAREMDSIVSSPEKQSEGLKDFIDSMFAKIDGDRQNAPEILRRAQSELSVKLGLLREAVVRMDTAGSPEPAAQAQKLVDHMRMLSQIDQFTYVQLPIMQNGQQKTAELFVYRDKKSGRRIDPENARILLSLDLENMGNVQAFVAIRGKEVALRLDVERQQCADFFRASTPDLFTSLMESGYKLTENKVRVAEREAGIEHAMQALMEFDNRSGAIDLRI